MNGITGSASCPETNTHCCSGCIVARTPEERDEVYRLRHEAYRRDGAIDPQPEGRFWDYFDTLPNSFSLLVRRQGREAKATVRMSVVRADLSWNEAPSRRVFGGDPAFEAIAEESYVEASRLCFGELARRDAFVKLPGHIAALSDIFETGWLVACPRVEHSHVYKRLFGFRQLAGPRQYFGVRFQTELLGVRREDIREYAGRRNCMLRAWNEALEELRRIDWPPRNADERR